MCQALSFLALLSTTVQILTPEELRAQELLIDGGWDVCDAHMHAALLALLVQKYKY